MEKINEILASIKNPVTAQTLESEKRIVSAEMKGNDLHIKYNREGIDPANKKLIEESIITELKEIISEENIYVLTESASSSDIYQATGAQKPDLNPEKPAKLRVGHGTVGEKKAIPGVKHVISIGSGKGGVGKSTFTANFAVTLAKKGYKVGIIDADIYGPSVPMMFNKRNLRPKSNDEQRIIPLESYGIKFISFGSFIHEDEPVVWRGPMLGGVLNQFFFETDWGELDYLLLDLPPGTGDVQLSMVQNIEVDGAIIISTPQDMALLDARKALHMFDKLDIHVIGMIENMSSFICDGCNKEHFLYGTGGVSLACSELGAGYLGKIPMDMGLRKGADFGKPYMEQSDKYEGQKVWNSYMEIASKVDSYFNPDDNKKKGILSKILNKQ